VFAAVEYTAPVAAPEPPPQPPPPGTPHRWSSLGILAAAGAVVGITSMVPWGGECGFRFVLGADCPGCGMTRALLALLRGDPAGSFRWHPLAIPLALAAAAAVALAVHEGATGRTTFRRAADRFGIPAAVAGIALLAAVWAVRVVLVPSWAADPIRPGSVAARWLL